MAWLSTQATESRMEMRRSLDLIGSMVRREVTGNSHNESCFPNFECWLELEAVIILEGRRTGEAWSLRVRMPCISFPARLPAQGKGGYNLVLTRSSLVIEQHQSTSRDFWGWENLSTNLISVKTGVKGESITELNRMWHYMKHRTDRFHLFLIIQIEIRELNFTIILTMFILPSDPKHAVWCVEMAVCPQTFPIQGIRIAPSLLEVYKV